MASAAARRPEPAITILDALRDPRLFGPFFDPPAPWSAWGAFLAALFGLPLDGDALATYRRHTGREHAPRDPFREAWVIAGRRGGKSRVAALVAVFLAAFHEYRRVLAHGERGTVMVIAADRRQARTVLRYVLGLLEGVPMLARMIDARRVEAIDLSNRVTIEVHTASFRAVRGYTIVAAILDEVAFWPTDDAAEPDSEIVAAIRPGMATVPGSLLLAISSPHARRGALWAAYRRYYAQEGAPVLVWRAPTLAMNPTVDHSLVAEAYEQDEVAAAAEYGAEFRRDVESFLSADAIDAVVVPGRRELPPLSGTRYVAFVDPSGGSSDSMTLAVAHQEKRDGMAVAVLDCTRERRPPFSPEDVATEFCELLHAYRITAAVGDRFGGEWCREPFRPRGISYDLADRPKSDIYCHFVPLVNSGRVELLDEPRLRTQLVALERRTARGGRDTIDHPPGGRDDLANCVAGVSLLLAKPAPDPLKMVW